MPPQSCASPSYSVSSSDSELKLCARCRAAAYCSTTCQSESWPSHKAVCVPENYVLRVQLLPSQIVDPPLHQALQLAFGWKNTHLFAFSSEKGPHPLRISSPDDEDDGFGFNDPRMGGPRPEQKNSARYKLCKYFEDEKFNGQTLMYEYDFDNSWEHFITVVDRVPPTEGFTCVSGTSHGVAENVGGSYGWQELKESYRIPAEQLTPDHRERRRWFEQEAPNRDPLGLEGDRVSFFDLDRCNQALGGVRVSQARDVEGM